MLKSANILTTAAVIVALWIRLTNTTRSYNTNINNVPICYQKDGMLIPMQGSCSRYFICIDGSAIASSCGSFYRFNPLTRHCDHPELVDCDLAEEVAADLSYNSVMPINSIIPKPQFPDEVVPDESAGDICYQKRNGELLPSMDSCINYYVCLQQLPYRRTCPTFLHFNAKSGLCQPPEFAGCSLLDSAQYGNVAETKGSSCDGMPDGILLPHDNECGKFYYCHNEQRNEMICPIALHFSVSRQRCEWPQFAGCAA